MTGTPRPITIDIPQAQLDDLKARLVLTRFPIRNHIGRWMLLSTTIKTTLNTRAANAVEIKT